MSVFTWKSVSLPESAIAGESFVISAEVTAADALFDKNLNAMLDSSGALLLPSDGEYTSAYSGDEINNFITEVL